MERSRGHIWKANGKALQVRVKTNLSLFACLGILASCFDGGLRASAGGDLSSIFGGWGKRLGRPFVVTQRQRMAAYGKGEPMRIDLG